MLAKRLIHTLSVSMDAEEGMISRLKVSTLTWPKDRVDLHGCPSQKKKLTRYLKRNHHELYISGNGKFMKFAIRRKLFRFSLI